MKEVYTSYNGRGKLPTVKFEFTEISREEIDEHFVKKIMELAVLTHTLLQAVKEMREETSHIQQTL